ncbi:uncharacterized protein LOC128206351 [Mya arenaria]|uniref:uncharacterized protein LOC128206351 n=1 Tax=Mya arenaria TaxID=6604 RepID=UPI0022E54CA8|nr:uncharacterized protein LOC128206351 [Mya arenaria]
MHDLPAFCVLALVVSGCAEAAGDHCYRSAVGNKPVPWPKHPLTFDDLKNTIMNGSNVSRNYYEIYDRSPAPPLPILRKVVINWKFNSSGYINDYAGYNPSDGSCIKNYLELRAVAGYTDLRFTFLSVFPTPENFTGTIFSSCPEKYHINFYCPSKNIIFEKTREVCSSNLRMSIYSHYGPNGLPWGAIAKDLCKNGSPPMEDPRWILTHDAPTQCSFANSRRRRDIGLV